MGTASEQSAFKTGWRGFSGALAGGWIDRGAAERRFDRMGQPPFWGDRVYVVAAHLFCFALAGPVTVVEIASAPLGVCVVLGAIRLWNPMRSLWLQPLVVASLLFWAWQAATWFWTPDQKQWLDQVGAARWLWLFWALWPLARRRGTLLAAMAAGYLAGNAMQLVHGLGVALQWEPLAHWRAADRISGWWPPVVGGSVLVAALGLHLPAAWNGAGPRARVLGIAGAMVTTAGVLATGTRGAWIAAAGLHVFAAVHAGTRGARLRGGRGLAIGALVVVVGAAAFLSWQAIEPTTNIGRRLHAGVEEVRLALTKHEYSSDTGMRVAMARWAVDAAGEHPVRGIGVGGFRAWVREHEASDPAADRVHDHAHNALLQVVATSGLIGLVPAMCVIVVGLRNAWVLAGGDGWRSIEAGPAYALVGLLMVSAFDPVQINAQTAAQLAAILALCPSFVPGREAGRVPGRAQAAAGSGA